MSKPAMTDGELLASLGTDAQKWADAFGDRFAAIPSRGTLDTWFANALEAGRTAGRADVQFQQAPAKPGPCQFMVAEQTGAGIWRQVRGSSYWTTYDDAESEAQELAVKEPGSVYGVVAETVVDQITVKLDPVSLGPVAR
jgi:hypothetical protein